MSFNVVLIFIVNRARSSISSRYLIALNKVGVLVKSYVFQGEILKGNPETKPIALWLTCLHSSKSTTLDKNKNECSVFNFNPATD